MHPAVDDPELLILRFTWSPHGPQRARKLAIQRAQPASDLVLGFGSLHCSTREQLDVCHAQEASWSWDLRATEPYASLYPRVAARAGAPPREHRVTVAKPGAPRPPLRAHVMGAGPRVDALTAALGDAAGVEPHELPVAGHDAAVVIPPSAWTPALIHEPGLVVVDLREPPEAVPATGPAISTITCPAAVAMLARADYLLVPSHAELAPWLPAMTASGRLDPATAGTEVLSLGDDPGPLLAFLADPVRRGQQLATSRTIEVSAAWAGFVYAWASMLQAQAAASQS